MLVPGMCLYSPRQHAYQFCNRLNANFLHQVKYNILNQEGQNHSNWYSRYISAYHVLYLTTLHVFYITRKLGSTPFWRYTLYIYRFPRSQDTSWLIQNHQTLKRFCPSLYVVFKSASSSRWGQESDGLVLLSFLKFNLTQYAHTTI